MSRNLDGAVNGHADLSDSEKTSKPFFKPVLFFSQKLKQIASLWARFLDQQQHQFPLWIPVFFGGGIACYFALKAEPEWAAIMTAVFLTLLVLARLFFSASFGTKILLLGALCFLGGFQRACWRTHALSTPMLTKPFGPKKIYGKIDSVTFYRKEGQEKSARVILQLQKPLHKKQRWRGIPARLHKVQLHVLKGFQHLKTGRQVQVFAKLNPFPAPTLPEGYNPRRIAYFQSLGGKGIALSAPAPWTPADDFDAKSTDHKNFTNDTLFHRGWRFAQKMADGGLEAFDQTLQTLRSFLQRTYYTHLKPDEAALATALLLGETQGISPAMRTDFANAGIAHLLAVSGLHMSIVAGLIFFIIRRLLGIVPAISFRYALHKIAALLTILFSFGYLHLSGARIPATRAFFMTTLAMAALYLGRSPLTLRLVAFAALFSLATAPENLLSPSFQLSFAAVTGLVAGFRRLRPLAYAWYGPHPGFLKKSIMTVGGVSGSTLIAGLATLPFTASIFHQITLLGTITNLLAIPWTSFALMPLGLLFSLCSAFSLQGWIAPAFQKALAFLTHLAPIISSMPAASVTVAAGWPYALPTIILSALWVLLWTGRLSLMGLPALVFGMAALFWSCPPDVFMDGEGKAMGFFEKQTGILWTSSSHKGGFAQKTWQRFCGARAIKPFPSFQKKYGSGHTQNGPDEPRGSLCRQKNCFIRTSGGWMLVFTYAAHEAPFAQSCHGLFSLEPVAQEDKRPVTIDRFDVWRQGPMYVHLQKKTMAVYSGKKAEGTRPWSRWKKIF